MRTLLTFVIAFVLFSSTAHADLINNLNGTITEIKSDGSRLMWLQDANYAETIGLSATGQITEAEAVSWASGLNFAGYTGWRLPTTNNNAAGSGGYNSNSEMGNLYYNELGNTGGNFVNAGPFFNIMDYWYFTSTPFAPGGGDTNTVMVFSFRDIPGSPTNVAGWEDAGNGNAATYVWLVRDASADLVPTPEPSSLALLSVGMAGFALIRRKHFAL
jgi:hypothetical protein